MLTIIKRLIRFLLRTHKRSLLKKKLIREEALAAAQYRYDSQKIKINLDVLSRTDQIAAAEHKSKMLAYKLKSLEQQSLLLSTKKKTDDELEQAKVIYQVPQKK